MLEPYPRNRQVIQLQNPHEDKRSQNHNNNCKNFIFIITFGLAVIPLIDRVTNIEFLVDKTLSESQKQFYWISVTSLVLVATIGTCFVWQCTSQITEHRFKLMLLHFINGCNVYMLIINGDFPFCCQRKIDQNLKRQYEQFQLKYSVVLLFIDDIPQLTYQFLVCNRSGAMEAKDIIVVVVTFLNILILVYNIVKLLIKQSKSNKIVNEQNQQAQASQNKILNKKKDVQNSLPPLEQLQKKALQLKKKREKEQLEQIEKKQKKQPPAQQQKIQQNDQSFNNLNSINELQSNNYRRSVYQMNGQYYQANTNPYLANDIFRVQGQIQMQQRKGLTGRQAEQAGYSRAFQGLTGWLF